MAYGDPTIYDPAIPWGAFGYPEYIDRLEDLLAERERIFEIDLDPLSSPRTRSDADTEYYRLNKALEETALEFAVYAARLNLGLVEGVT